jgi:hypothetical protein
MHPIDFLKKTNTVLLFVLLVSVIVGGGYLILRSQRPVNPIHISVDSVRVNKK